MNKVAQALEKLKAIEEMIPSVFIVYVPEGIKYFGYRQETPAE